MALRFKLALYAVGWAAVVMTVAFAAVAIAGSLAEWSSR
jgi:hypothetical protein